MNCPQSTLLLNAYIDNELDIPHILDFEQHLETCPSCTDRLNAAKALRNSLRSLRAAEDPLPSGLEFAIRSRLRQMERQAHSSWAGWASAAASIAAVALVALLLRQVMLPRVDTSTTHDIVASHVRSLMGSHLMDVPSSEQHTVKPWFAGKLDYSPPVTDFAAQGFPLVGGRVDYVASRPVAVVIYKRRQHIINYYVWPDQHSPVSLSSASDNGFHIEHWVRDGLNHWLVSDLNAAELKQFAALLSVDPGHR